MKQFALVLLALLTLRPLLAEDFTANWMLDVRQENARSLTQITWNLRSDPGRFDNTLSSTSRTCVGLHRNN